ncbi:MAG: HAMP domain-containing protein, partial [Burkholderiaceae bacterium]|nr:HAMP domain-containing protein [Burkholderiaceae bacterium]
KPAREQVKLAEQAYASIRAGNPQRLAIRQGQTVRAGLLGRLTNLSLRARAMTALGSLAAMFLGMGGGGYCLLEGTVAQGFGAAGLIGALAVLLLERSIAHAVGAPLKQATQAARAIAGGDLGNPILSERRDDMGKLLRSMEQMRLNLVAIIDDVHHSVDGIAVATREIALGNADLAQRTQRQASRLEETTDSMGQLAAAVQQNAGSAQEVSGLVVDATGTAQAGGVAVDKVRVTMEGIGEVGRRIEEIIGMIDAIAFQTNLLALNAAVEAAKACEAGRGFAVVASEVRSLAQRSGHASKQIRSLLQDTIAQLEQGNRQVADASQTMRAIEVAVQRVNVLMCDMAEASREQSLGIGEVNRTLVEMDANTQQNAAMVEQVAAAASSLDEQAGRLTQAVSIFKLGRQAKSGSVDISFQGHLLLR